MQTVISYYALAKPVRETIEAEYAGECRYEAVGRLRNLGIRGALKEIRALRAEEVLVAIGEESARPLAGPLLLLAALTGSRRIRMVWPDGRFETVPRARALSLLAHLAGAQVTSRAALRSAMRQARRLAGGPPVPARARPGGSILYLDANLSFGLAAGGSVGHIRGVVDAFVRRGFRVDYASVKPIPTDVEGSTGIAIPAPELLGFPPELNYYPFALAYEEQVAKRARGGDYAFLYQRMSLHNFSGARLRAALGLPLVLEYNGSEAWAASNWGQRLRLHDEALAAERAALANADLVVTVSKVLGDEVERAGVPSERIVVYPNCIDPAIFDPDRFRPEDRLALRRRLGIRDDATVAAFVGTFGTWHGVDFLARAVRRLVDERRDFLDAGKLHFLFVGDGLKMPEVRASVGEPPYSGYVTLAGLVPQGEAPAYLAASDIFLSPHLPNADGSAFFGSPTKLFEYMAMGKPIVASDLDQIGAVLKNAYLEETDRGGPPLAALFRPGDEDGFIAALASVVDHPDTARATAARAREAALEFYTWDRHVAAILDRMRALGITDG